ncbi:hypothetical protein D1007_31913 [Hordeum vulgare]|nr:hypothetical protein D1007_31913 [Hordeum vulgare]
MVGGFPKKGKAPLFPRAISPPSSSHRPRQGVSVPMHQTRWHWEHRMPLPYPDVTLPHDCHLDPERIPVPAVPRSTRVHAKEVSRRRRLLTAEKRRDPTHAAESPNWEVWFAVEHEEQRRRGVCEVQPGGPLPPPPVVSGEDQVAEAAYHATLVGVLRDSEEEAWHMAEEEVAYQQQLVEAIALSVADDCVMPPLPEPEPCCRGRSTSGPASSRSSLVRRPSSWARHRSRSKPTSSTGGRSTCGRSGPKACGSWSWRRRRRRSDRRRRRRSVPVLLHCHHH